MIKDRIKELREKNGLTISAFAKSLGISPTSASLYESGKQNPGKKTIGKICEVYGVDEGYLLSAAADKGTSADKATTTTKEDDKASTNETDKAVEEKKKGRRPKKTDVVSEEKEPDISAILARVAEIGVRKAAAEAGVAWQTVNKWRKDAEKAALSSSEEIQKAVDNLTTPEGAQEAVTKVMEMITPETEEKEQKEEQKEIDISSVLSRVAEIGVRKAAAEIGVAWQTVNKWKKDAEKAALSSSEEIQKAVDNLTTPEGAQEAVAAPGEEERKEKEEPDIPAVLARVAEIGVRKAAAEAGVAWQTVNKWKKDAEKAALPSSEDIGKSVGEIIEAAGEISDGIQKTLDNLTTPEGAQEAVTKVMEVVTSTTEEKEQKEEQKKEQKKDQIDISAVLSRVAEIGVRKAAAEIGVAWQTVNKWKKDAAATQTTPISSTAQNKEENKAQEKKEEKKEGKKEQETAIIIQSPMGGNITPEQILSKIPACSDSVYVRVDENKLYWVKGDENGAVDIWG